MQAIYKLMASEVNEDLLKAIRSLFKNQVITITIDSATDETVYLSSNKANLEHLTENDKSIEKKYFKGDSFQSFVNDSVAEIK